MKDGSPFSVLTVLRSVKRVDYISIKSVTLGWRLETTGFNYL